MSNPALSRLAFGKRLNANVRRRHTQAVERRAESGKVDLLKASDQ
jgi:hypothetical protein